MFFKWDLGDFFFFVEGRDNLLILVFLIWKLISFLLCLLDIGCRVFFVFKLSILRWDFKFKFCNLFKRLLFIFVSEEVVMLLVNLVRDNVFNVWLLLVVNLILDLFRGIFLVLLFVWLLYFWVLV